MQIDSEEFNQSIPGSLYLCGTMTIEQMKFFHYVHIEVFLNIPLRLYQHFVFC